MLYSTLPQIAHRIQNTHVTFGEHPVEDCLDLLGRFNKARMECPSMVGATWEALTDMDHGALHTLITVTRLPEGGWDVTEVMA